MKVKILIFSAFLFLLISENTFAQGPPRWAPAHGYRAKTKHIYFPQQNFYYDIERHDYIYLNNGVWTVSVSIPTPFININLGNSRQVELDFVGNNPYRYNSAHVVKYKKYKPKKNRIIIFNKNYRRSNHGEHGKSHGKH